MKIQSTMEMNANELKAVRRLIDDCTTALNLDGEGFEYPKINQQMTVTVGKLGYLLTRLKLKKKLKVHYEMEIDESLTIEQCEQYTRIIPHLAGLWSVLKMNEARIHRMVHEEEVDITTRDFDEE